MSVRFIKNIPFVNVRLIWIDSGPENNWISTEMSWEYIERYEYIDMTAWIVSYDNGKQIFNTHKIKKKKKNKYLQYY